jgi:3-oxoacyl-[acyl-carrier-protein] synthase-3
MDETGVAIIGVGHHLPATIQDNAELCRTLDVTPEWIVEKTGITQRRIAGPDDTASGFALEAARQALDMATVEADEIDLIIACTFAGDYVFPPVSAKIQQQLRAANAQVFDLQANCAGFVTGLTAASDRMRCDGSVRHALVVGVELCSRFVDRSDVNTAIYLSDGAGAAVLGRCDPGTGILASAFFTDSSNYESVRLRGGGSSHPFQGRAYDPLLDCMEMNGIATWKQAVTHLPSTIRRACVKAGVELHDVDFLVLHQANRNLIEYIVRKMGFGIEKTYINVHEIGNAGSASVAIALSEAVARGCLAFGDYVVLAGVGAGFNFAASVWKWGMHAPGEVRS